MSSQNTRYLITGANGQLGRLVLESLVKKVAPADVTAMVRKPENAASLASLGVNTVVASYDDPASLDAALAGVDALLLISSSEIGKRAEQHKNVVDAAKKAGVKLLAYTSILRADTSPLQLAAEHVATEAMIKASGLPYAFLRNSWYNENYLGSIEPALQHGAVASASGEGRISAAARADYAEAAAVVLASGSEHAGKIYELAGDDAFTMADLAATLAELSGKPIVYSDMPEAAYAELLVNVGLPAPFAAILADSAAGAGKGGLFDDSKTLSRLIGRPTTPLKATLAAALKG